MTKSEWKRLDKLAEISCKDNAGWRCEVCGRSKEQGWQIHYHHFIGRKKTSLRWIRENLFALCFVCHDRMENDPQWAVKTARDMRGDRWYRMIEKLKVKINKMTFEENKALIDEPLEAIIKQYKI
jgi:biotin synthase-related radical SAM superfamily protein